MRISDWSSDVCSSDLLAVRRRELGLRREKLRIDLAEFGARRIDALCGRTGAATDQPDILRLERGTACLDLAQRLFTVGDLRIEEFQALARVHPAAAQLGVANHGDQAVEHARCELGIEIGRATV